MDDNDDLQAPAPPAAQTRILSLGDPSWWIEVPLPSPEAVAARTQYRKLHLSRERVLQGVKALEPPPEWPHHSAAVNARLALVEDQKERRLARRLTFLGVDKLKAYVRRSPKGIEAMTAVEMAAWLAAHQGTCKVWLLPTGARLDHLVEEAAEADRRERIMLASANTIQLSTGQIVFNKAREDRARPPQAPVKRSKRASKTASKKATRGASGPKAVAKKKVTKKL